MIDVKSIEFLDRFSTTGTNNLVAPIGARMKAVIDLYVHWEIIEGDVTFYGDQIILNNGDWFNYGFKNGDTIEVIISPTASSPGAGANAGSYQIVGLTNQIAQVVVQAGSGSGSASTSTLSPASFTTEVGVSYYAIHGTTPITALDFYYGLVKNTDADAYTSLLDGETQKYRATSLDQDAPTANTLIAQGVNKSWLSTFAAEDSLSTVTETGIGTSGVSYGYEQCFQIEHVFRVEPVLTDGIEDTNGDLDISLTPFAGSDCLRYVFKAEAGFTTSAFDHSTDDGNIASFLNDGDSGWFDEFRNGGSANYTVSGISYANAASASVDSLQKSDVTTVVITLDSASANFTADTNFEIYVYELPSDTADYKNTTTRLTDNFSVSTAFASDSGGAFSNNKISNGLVTVSSGSLAFIEFDYTAGADLNKYAIFVIVGDEAITDLAANDTMAVLCDYNQIAHYIYLPDNVITLPPVINEHSKNDIEYGFSDWKGWIEDGILAQWRIRLLDSVGANDEYAFDLDSVTVEVIAENATDSTRNFTLETDTITPTTSSTRGFVLYSGDPKNYRILSFDGSGGGRNGYTLQWATKGRYETWLSQTNADATDFPNATKNWSDFILSPDWSLKFKFTLNCTADDGTDTYSVPIYVERPITLLDYDEYFNCQITAEIETFHGTTGDNLNGKLSKTANTIVKARAYGKELFPCIYQNNGDCSFTDLISGSGSASYSNSESGALDNCPEYYGILELDKGSFGGSEFNIEQASTLWPLASGIAWTSQPSIVMYPFASTPYIEMIGEIDVNSLDLSVPSYKISARFGKDAQTICNVSIMAKVTATATTFTHSGLVGFTLSDLLIFSSGFEISNNATGISGDTISFNKPIGRNIKICCSVDEITGTGPSAVETITIAALIGLTSDDFIMFAYGSPFNGKELTTLTGFTFNSGTGEITGIGVWSSNAYQISFHQALISDTVTSVSTYTDPLIAGLNLQDIMVFVNGIEYTTFGLTITGSTLNFSSPVSGTLKVVKVFQ